ncbi:MAG TPA: MOSC domain-containing protein [Caulobacteraceae bacterium]|nr:MOSC domain-containing protein [Caulobacteraceae bacterium]
MAAAIAALFRHPIKGFSPEKVKLAPLSPGNAFPGDRLYALEDGPSGFDPARPAFIPKQRFAVLAKIAEVAKARTRLDDATGLFHAEAEGMPKFAGDLAEPEGRTAFAAWVTRLLGEAASGPLRLLDGEGHRFLDHPSGHVSIVNLASVRDLEQRLSTFLDPLRFRANVYVEGWPPWAENDWTGRPIALGEVETEVFKPIVRCAAPGVDPATAIRDLDVPAELYRLYGHAHCGIYVHVKQAGVIADGDPVSQPA